ncbi:hypothetical protein BYT27DRAFT_7217503 [Phlegmacium glaucopus]|nr:hypothetical protein BYT27DRAFT_7217503 [Phlegmacium glaucopus]
MTPSTLPQSKMKRVGSTLYVKRVIQQEIEKDPASFKDTRKGIIATRETFLRSLKMEQGVEELGTLDEKDREPGSANNYFSKTIVVPVAIPGCGKTSVAFDFAPKKTNASALTLIFLDSVLLKVTMSMPKNPHRYALYKDVSLLGLEMPSDEKIREALPVDVVKGYAPAVKRPDDPKKKKVDARYYGLLPEVDLLDPILVNETKDFWTKLKTDNRLTHLTTVHRSSINKERELWGRCAALHEMTTTTPPLFKKKMVWNGRVMAIMVEDFDLEVSSSGGDDDEGQEGHESVSGLPYDVRERLDITVRTKKKRSRL